jgi:hypothetical protein
MDPLHLLILLKPDETIAIVARGEPFMLFPFVLKDAFVEVARHSDIERVAAAGHDVSEVGGPIGHIAMVDRTSGIRM